MFEQAFRNIDDVLWKEAGCTTELDYTEQTSWLLFLKYLDGLEQDRAAEQALAGKRYTYILDAKYRWENWAAPKTKDGKLDHQRALSDDTLVEFVNNELFPYLAHFTTRAENPDSIEYKIGQIFGEIKTGSVPATACGRSLTRSISLNSAPKRRNTSCPCSTRTKSGGWATLAATAANTTPRAP